MRGGDAGLPPLRMPSQKRADARLRLRPIAAATLLTRFSANSGLPFTDANLRFLRYVGEGRDGELAALIGVEYLRLAMAVLRRR